MCVTQINYFKRCIWRRYFESRCIRRRDKFDNNL